MIRRFFHLALFLCLALVTARPVAAAGGLRTLVVRGRIANPDGTPAAGARVTARGAMTMSATTDDRGRYSLSMPMGSPAGLRNGAFRAEVRAEDKGRKLALASGAPALVIEMALESGTTKLRVRSNSPAATAAVITAFAQDGALTAWVEADFGGAVRATQALELSAVDEVLLGGIAPAPAAAAPPRESPRERKVPPPASKPRPVATGSPSAPPAPAAIRPKPAVKPRAAVEVIVPPVVAVPRASVPVAARPEPPAASTAPAAPAAPAARPRVVTIEPFAPPPFVESADTCACRLRGTVEVNWERPLEKDIGVDLWLQGPAQQSASVDLFMGPPREFRLGPLPCGDYRLIVRARGKYRYALVRGDSVVTVRCVGSTQTRVVLEPVKR